jgi:hypothetical protein
LYIKISGAPPKIKTKKVEKAKKKKPQRKKLVK